MIQRIPGLIRDIYRNRQRQDVLPRVLTYTVTFGCNAKCIMCDSWKMSTDGDLTTEEVASIFKQLPQMDAVRLTGGEPFVRRDMLEITQLAVQYLKPLFIHVTSNGFLTQRIVEFCEQRPRKTPLDLLISIDGIGDKHNTIRGNSRAYDSCLETIAALAPRRKELNLKLAVNQTIVDADGVEHYRKLRDVLKQYDVHNHVVMAYDISATYNMEQDVDVAPTEVGQFTTFGEFSTAHLTQLLDDVAEDIKSYPLLQRLAKSYYLKGIRNRLLSGAGTPNPPCTALHSHLRIFPNGDVPTCQFNSRKIGNLRKESFEQVWASVAAKKQRDWVRGCPGCWAECEVLPSAVYSLDLLLNLFRRTPRVLPGSRMNIKENPAPAEENFVELQTLSS